MLRVHGADRGVEDDKVGHERSMRAPDGGRKQAQQENPADHCGGEQGASVGLQGH
jgi:hypothetical protein